MSRMLAGLIAQAEQEGARVLTLRALVEEASEAGATRALMRVGLGDPTAGADVAALRELLGAWRDAKKSARGAVIAWLVRGVLAALVMGLAVKLGLTGLMEG